MHIFPSLFTDTHVLVNFEEDCNSVVPIRRVKKIEGSQTECDVVWSDTKLYRATVIFSGKLYM